MQRSFINAQILLAQQLLNDFRFTLPEWAYWSPMQMQDNPELAKYLYTHQMGWDVTDFSKGQFDQCGLTLFCLRNGVQSERRSKPYAEKLLFVAEGQVTPFHYHRVKMEDIINRGGGNLIFEFIKAGPNGEETSLPVSVMVDGVEKTVPARTPLRLKPGQSATMNRSTYHCFYAEPGHGQVLAGEVSQVNDDETDNYFLEPLGRFSNIEEDEPALYPLWSDLGGD